MPGVPVVPGLSSSGEAARLIVARALASAQVSVVITQADGGHQIVWADENFTTLTGYPLDEALGHSHRLLHGPGTNRETAARMHDGGVTTLTLLFYRKDGTPFWDRVVVAPVHDDDGQVTHHAVVHVDAAADIVTERTQAVQEVLVEHRVDRMRLINRVVGALTEHVDYRQAADALARTAVPELADWGFVVMFDKDGMAEYFTDIVADPAKSESARIVEPSLPGWIGNLAWAGQVPRLHQALNAKPADPILPQPADVALIRERISSQRVLDAVDDLGLGARLPVPLVARDRTLGMLVLEARDPDRFDVPTVVTTTLLRRRVSTALDNIRLYQARKSHALTGPARGGGEPREERWPSAAGSTVDGSEPPGDEPTGLEIAVQALLTARLPVLVSDSTTGKIVWANDPYCQMIGWTQEELIGRTWETMHTAQPDEAYTARMIDALNAGETVAMTLLNRRRNDTLFWSRMIVAPVCDSDGEVTHTFAVHSDVTSMVVTEHAQAAEAELAANRNSRLELITQAVDALTEQVDYHQAAEVLARTVVPELADWAFVVLFDDDGRPEYFTDIVADPTRLESARIAGQDLPLWFRERRTLNVAAVNAKPEDPILPQLVDIDLLAAAVPSRRLMDALHDLGLGARLPVPLFARDRTQGLLMLEARDPDRFDVPTVVTTTLLRSRVSTVLDNIRLYQTERQVALTLQNRLLPPTITVDGIDTATVYRPSANRAEIGGDWYDVFPLGERGTMLAVGDVVGHDMSAAAAMGQVSVLLRARSWISASPGPTLTTIAQTLEGMRWDDVASVACLRWLPTDDGGSHVEYANLGHPAPFIRLPDGSVHQMPPAHGVPLGLHDPALDISQDEFDLPAGSVVVLYTDGLVERRDRPLQDGLAALAQALRDTPDGTAAQIRDHLLTTLVPDHPEDDVCLLVVRGQSSPTAPDRQADQAATLMLTLDDIGEVTYATR